MCTQSCTVVSPCLIRDPLVEIAKARPLAKYSAKSGEARGRNVCTFHLPVGDASFEALEININSRRFINREALLRISPASFSVTDGARRNFAGWIARYYMRIALPNELVKRLNVTILGKLEPFLKGKLDDGSAAVHHEEIASMWIKFTPDAELSHCDVELMMLCDDPTTAEVMDKALESEVFASRTLTLDGVGLSFEVMPTNEMLLSDLNGWHRFTEWDYFSRMGEAAAIPAAS